MHLPLVFSTGSAIPEASISAAFSSLSKYIAVSYSCDGQLLSRLDVNAASAVAHVCDATSATIACVSQCASIFVNRARSHQRRADKLLEMRLEEFDAALKNLKSYLEYGSVVVLDTVDVEDSCAVVNLIVGGQLSAFPLVSTVVTVGGCGTAMHCVGHFSIVDAGVDGDRCIVSRTPFLPRGEPNTVTVVLIGVDGEPLYGVTPADMAIRVEEDAVDWSVAAVSVEANVVSIEVGLTRECNVEADLIIVIGCAALTYPLMVRWHDLRVFFVECFTTLSALVVDAGVHEHRGDFRTYAHYS